MATPRPPKQFVGVRLERRMVELLQELAGECLHDGTLTHQVSLACEGHLKRRGKWPPKSRGRAAKTKRRR